MTDGALDLKDDLNVTSVTAGNGFKVDETTKLTSAGLTVGSNTSLTADTLTVGGKAYITSTGLNANGVISGVGTATKNDEAVNLEQMKTAISDAAYESGKGITVTQKTDDQKGSIAVNAGKGLGFDEQDGNKLMVNTGDGLTVDSSNKVTVKYDDTNLTMTDGALDLKDIISLEKVTATDGFYVTENGPSLTTDGLKIDENTGLTSTGLTTPQGTFSTSVTVGSGDTAISIESGSITGLSTPDGRDESAAVNVGYLDKYIDSTAGLAVQYDDKNLDQVTLAGDDGTVITNVADGVRDSDAVNFKQLDKVDKKVGDAKWNNANVISSTTTDLTTAVDELDGKMGTVKFTGTNLLSGDTDLTTALKTLDTRTGTLDFTGGRHISGTQSTITAALMKLDETIGNFEFENSHYLQTIDNGSGTVATALQLLDDRVAKNMTLLGIPDGSESISFAGSNYMSSASSLVGGMEALDSAIAELDSRVDKLESPNTQSNTPETTNTVSTDSTVTEVSAESAPTETTATEAPTAATMESAVAKAPAAAKSMLTSAQPMTMALNAPAPLANGDPSPVENPNPDGSNTSNIHTEGDMTTVEKNFTVTGDATFKQGASMGGHKITDVAAGTEDTDGVNYGQLKEVQNQVDANSQNIGILGSAVNKLGDRIERVGAGAAALAALHPLDFDPDNKLDFAAGFGNYRGASAVAVGAFYRPSENVMFSVGGAFGGGEDMVNAGVSFKVGAGSGSATTSRTAMAKSLKSMQEVVASQDAQLAQQREQIDKLTAMVELLMEQNGQAQPKDGDAQAAQPQQ